jgi:hypothetical protein
MTTKGEAVALKINAAKTKTMRINAKSKERFKANDKDVDDVEEFTYLGSVVTTTGGTEDAAFIQLYPVCKAKQISIKTKIKIFSSNVKSVLLYGCETWKVRKKMFKKETFAYFGQWLLQMNTYGN